MEPLTNESEQHENVFPSDGEHVYFTSTVNKGIFQLLEYLDFCSESQTFLRDTMQLPNFREPKGLIIIGTEEEFLDKRKQKLKAAWNRMLPKQLEIRSYSWLLNTFKANDEHLNFRKDKSVPSGF